MVKLVRTTNPGASAYLKGKGFTPLPSEAVNGQLMNRFSKKSAKGAELIIKTQSLTTDRKAHNIVDYNITPNTFAATIAKELLAAKFKIATNIHDKTKDNKLYDNGTYTVSVYTFTDKRLPAAIEIRVK
ncbi:hypothetical protein GCM10028827_45080 [Mucilaginibacter myungsuensis]